MKNSKRIWRASLFILLLAALCGSFAFPVVNVPVKAAPPMQTGTADLSITMTVNNTTPNKEDPVIFTIKVSNAGPDVATGVSIKDILPLGFDYVSDNSGGTYDTTTGIWIVGSVPVGVDVITLNIITKATEITLQPNWAEIWTSDQFDPDSFPGNDSTTEDDDDSKTVTPRSSDISLGIQWIVPNTPPTTVNVGDIITFRITATNGGPHDATGVQVVDLLPAGLTYVTHTSTGVYTVSTGNWSVDNLNSGASKNLDITARVTTGPKINIAEVTVSEQLDPDSTPANGATTPSEDDYVSFTLNSPISDISLSMNVSNTTPYRADNVVFTITVSNAGPNTATGVTVRSLLPAGITYVSHTPGAIYNSSTGIWSVGTLTSSGAGSNATLTLTARATTTGTKTQIAEVWTSNQSDPDSTPGNGSTTTPEDDFASATITPKSADISLTKTINTSNLTVGNTVIFTLTARNAGPDDATGVRVEDLLPAGYYYQSHSGTGTYENGTGLWTIGTLVRNTSARLDITAVVTSDPDRNNRTEVIASDQLDPDSTPDNASVLEDDYDTAPKIDLSVNKAVNNSIPPLGTNITFTLTVNNAGPAAATGVTIKDVLPSGLVYVSHTSGSAYDSGTGIWTVGTIQPGATMTLSITARANAIGNYTNLMEVWTADQVDVDSIPGNNSTTTDDDASAAVTVSYGFMSILINEVAWAGTAASTSDEWIELYNPSSSPINFTGWTLKAVDGTPTISLPAGFVLQPGEYFLLERTDDTTISDILADQIYTGELSNSSEILQLLDPLNKVIDTANSNGGNWPAGSSSTFGSMERRAGMADSDTAWITNTGVTAWGKDAGIPNDCTTTNPPCLTLPALLKGTPKRGNWAYTVTPTPLPNTTTVIRTPTRIATVVPPPPLVAINEFVPRPGHDWNHDGIVNVKDEYIELINHGTVNVTLSGYSLDDEVNLGSDPYRLPAVTLKPGQRIVFYGSETGILLSDGGDGVRLLKPNGQLADAYNYFVVGYPDQSYCRIPDNGGADDWNQNCFPTPGLQNSLNGDFVSSPGGRDESVCPISDTLPQDFVQAECDPFGMNIWRRAFWDLTGWFDERYLPDIESKWPVFAD